MPQTITEQIAQAEQQIADTRKKIATLKAKEAKRIIRLAEKSGYFEVDLTDAEIEQALRSAIDSARSKPSSVSV